MRRQPIGALRHRVRIESQVRTADGGGGAIVTWASLGEVWAGIRPVSGTEAPLAEQQAGRITHEIILRHRADIVPAMRLALDDRHFDIVAVLDVDERRRHLRCLCREDLL